MHARVEGKGKIIGVDETLSLFFKMRGFIYVVQFTMTVPATRFSKG